MARLTPRFSANRTVREYTERHYLPAAAAYRERSARDCADARRMLTWQKSLEQHWGRLRFGEVTVETRGEQHVFEAQVWLEGLEPSALRVELYADGALGGAAERQEMQLVTATSGPSGAYLYRAAVSAARPADHYTARLLPARDGVAIPLEVSRISWQR
jgi:starch phosphorylase